MSRNVSTAFKNAAFSQSTSEVFIALVTISHTSFTDDLRVASDAFEVLPVAGVRGVVSDSVEYPFLPFDLVLPGQDETGVTRARLVLDNVGREAMAAIRGADSAVDVTIRIVLASDPDTVEYLSPNFKLTNVRYNKFTIEGELMLDYYGEEPFPAGTFTPSFFPGMF